MELDDLERGWAVQFADHEQRLADLEQQLAAVARRRAGRALAPTALGWVVEALLVGAAAVAIGPRIVAAAANPRYLVVGGVALLFLVAWCAAAILLLVRTLRIDFAQPVVALQRDLARLQFVGFAALAGLLAGGVLAWLPVALLLFEAGTGVPLLARVDGAWLAGNLALGAVVLVAAIVWARRYAGDPQRRPRLDHLAAALSGRGLRRARAQLAELDAAAREA